MSQGGASFAATNRRQEMKNNISTLAIISVIIVFGLLFISIFKEKSVGYMTVGGETVSVKAPSAVTKEEWKKKLSPGQYQLLWEKGTEKAFSGEYLYNKRKVSMSETMPELSPY